MEIHENIDLYERIEDFNEKLKRLKENYLFNLTDNYDESIKKVELELRDLINRNHKLYKDMMKHERIDCVICETGDHWLIDGILKEEISRKLVPEYGYIIVPDGFSPEIRINGILPTLKVISRSKNQWTPLENSFIFTSSRNDLGLVNYINSSYLCNPCLLILVLQSPSELQNDDVKSFLSKVCRDYRYGNFILVFNESDRKACTKLDECRDCFPEQVLSFLKTTNIKFENRTFKVSTILNESGKELVEVIIPNDTHLNKFDDLRQVIENELHIETVTDKLCDNTVQICKYLRDIRQYFDKTSIKKSIKEYQDALKNNSNRLNEEINNLERKGKISLISSWTVRLEADSKFTEKEIIDSFIEIYQSSVHDFGKSLTSLSGACATNSTNIGVVAKDMFLNKYLKVEEMNDKIKTLVKINFRNIDETSFENHNVENQARNFQAFVDAIESVNKKVFEVPKKAFVDLFEKFVPDTRNMLKEIRETIIDEVDKLNELRLSTEINDYLKILKFSIRQKVFRIKKQLEALLNEIRLVIKRKDKCHFSPKSLGYFIVDTIKDINIQLRIKTIKKKIKSNLNPIFQDVQDVQCEDLFKFGEIDRLATDCGERLAIFLGNLNEDKYYQFETRYANWFLKLIGVQSKKRFIKFKEIMKEFDLVENSIFNNIDEISKIINTTINKSIKLRELIENDRNRR